MNADMFLLNLFCEPPSFTCDILIAKLQAATPLLQNLCDNHGLGKEMENIKKLSASAPKKICSSPTQSTNSFNFCWVW